MNAFQLMTGCIWDFDVLERCHICGEKNHGDLHFIPMINGEVDFSSPISLPVCKKCYIANPIPVGVIE